MRKRWSKSRSATFPIAILSFDRPAYLSKVLSSLKPQLAPGQRVILFQDGAWNPWSNRWKADEAAIAECVDLFRTWFPDQEVQVAPSNLGIALNYERAETRIFEQLGAPEALFLEDDMWLSPNYLAVIARLLDFARTDDRIAYVSAYGNLFDGIDRQNADRSGLLPMHENWGAALTRAAWLAERPFRRTYLSLLSDCDYSRRDHAAIRDFYRQRGWKVTVTSQDAARWVAALERGAVRITTQTCHARYIGMTGEHFTAEQYEKVGFHMTTPWIGRAPSPDRPTDDQIAAWLAAEHERFMGRGEEFYPGHEVAERE